jgi:hypothetical protein
MKNFATFASDIRLNTLLCCSAAVLLTACGGSNIDAAQGAQTAASVASVNTPAANADATVPNQVDAAAAQGNAAGTGFELSGYSADQTADSALAAQEAPADGAPRLLASVTWVKTPINQAPTVPATTAPASTGASMAIPATAINYYVSPTGSDSAAGTKAAPFKTLAGAAKKATKPGTTVFVAPGSYAGGIQTSASGTASARIYWVSTTKGGAKIVPPSSSSNAVAWDNRGNYVSIIGFDVDGSNSGSGTKWAQGIYTGGSYGMIADNHIHHIAQNIPCTSNGGSAIGVDSYYHGVKTDVVGNVVNDIGPAGCTYVQGIYVSTSGTIKNNLVYRVAEAAIHLWHDATDVIITNNTVTNSGYGIIVGGGDFYFTSAGANNVFVANNIAFANKYGISEQGKTGTANKYQNNLVVQNSTYNISLRNGLKDSGTVSSNPLFVAYSATAAAPNFHITSSSPAVGRATASNAYATDLDGKARNASTGYDIGAYQH